MRKAHNREARRIDFHANQTRIRHGAFLSAPVRWGILALALGVVFPGNATLQAEANSEQHSGPLEPDPALAIATAKNGIRLYAIANDRPIGSVSIVVHVPYGAESDPETKEGLAHFTEHLFFQNRFGESGKTLEEKLRALGLQNGSGLNALTTPTHTKYEFQLHPEAAGNLEEVFAALGEALSGWRVLPEDLEKERKIIHQEIMTRAGVGLDHARASQAVLFGGTPNQRVDLAGTQESVDRITSEDIHAFAEKAFAPNGLRIFIAGDLDQETVLKPALARLEEISPSAIPAPAEPPKSADRSGASEEVSSEVVLNSPGKSGAELVIAWPLTDQPLATLDDLRHQLAEAVACEILQLSLQRLSETNPQVLLANAGLQPDTPGMRYLAAVSPGTEWEALLESLVRTIPPDGIVPQAELDAAVELVRSRIARPPEPVDSLALANSLADAVAIGSVPASDSALRKLILEALDEITLETVRPALVEFSRLETARYVLTLPEGEDTAGFANGMLLEAAKAAFAKRDDSPASGSRGTEFAVRNFPEPWAQNPLPAENLDLEGNDLLVATTPSGHEIQILKNDRIAAGRFHLRLVFDRGENMETPDTRGAMSLLAYHLERGGDPAGRETEFKNWLDQRQISLSIKSEPAVFSIQMEGPSHEARLVLQVLHHILSSDAMPSPSTIARWASFQRMTATSKKTEAKSAASRYLRQMLFPGDLSAVEIPEERLDTISADEVARLWEALRGEGIVRLTMLGNGEADSAEWIQTGTAALSVLPGTSDNSRVSGNHPLPGMESTPAPLESKGWSIPGTQNSEVRVVYAVPSSPNPLDRAAIEIQTRILDRRLQVELRENRGLTYQQRARFVTSVREPESWFVILEASCDPANAEQVKEKMIHTVDALGMATDIPPGEMERAYEDWLTDLRRTVENPRALLKELSLGESQLDWIRFCLKASCELEESRIAVQAHLKDLRDSLLEPRIAVAFPPEDKAAKSGRL